MSPDDAARADAWEASPCGLLTLRPDGTIVDANATFLAWAGRGRSDLVGHVRLSQLLSVGGRIYWETHLSPMLHADGRVEEIAVELSGPDGRMPVLLTAVVVTPAPGAEPVVRVVLSGARERSRYERELLAARREAEHAGARTQVLQRATAALSRAGGTDAVVRAVLEAAEADLGARAAAVWMAAPAGGLVLAATTTGADDPGPPPSVSSADEGARVVGGRVVVPLRGRSRLHGVFAVLPREDPAAEPLDLDVLGAVAQQAGLALDRSLLHEQSSQVAHELQRALITARTPLDPRFVLATTYRPGVADLEVGGDWYDGFLVEDDLLAVVVGDVVGRGLSAAIAMGQLRSAVRAVAAPGLGPAGVLSHLDRFVQQVDAAVSATVVYAEVALRTGHVRYACAGHLPPLLVPGDGDARLVWGGRSRPLGVATAGSERAEDELTLAPGDQLLLYTDGLVERRDRSLRVGLEVLTDTADAVRGLPPGESVEAMTSRLLLDEETSDDVCVLLLAWSGAG
ncbi:SpoIIE family protein phosphatase [Georgenia wangjunii]|uniref:SpoIIE family protein phosphatase n=1 Tax=Georgenia wangjunii TaxID=3117730 RepID=UPI002F26342D